MALLKGDVLIRITVDETITSQGMRDEVSEEIYRAAGFGSTCTTTPDS
jgi:hypothetical protein